ncbi:peptidase M3A and M3B domain-containing protein [Tieghemostelium lacteum]|uniref:Peptidase M3A and M3B domain-containing protein n=1 Tax=Tieghemostelium lacteum TaxID=361077 RepID=A0A151Z641_TIELA|nr:peptidase M3A and M3B domain-containing protein [Tieghemostelium lacteum]|eukprot:KYQ89422.1 peptidase M3A and M3B domain-containing protein [Tieghemostelium lacteum]
MTTVNNEYVKLNFPTKPEEFKERSKKLIEDQNKALEKFLAIPKEQLNFKNAFIEMDRIDAQFSNEESSLTFPSSVHTQEEFRKVSNEVEAELSKYCIETSAREDLYKHYLSAIDQIKSSGEFEKLDSEDKRLIEKTMISFEKNGLQLAPEVREKVKELKKKIADNCTEFSKNIAEDKTKLEFTKEQLDGVPEDVVSGYEKHPEKPNTYLVSLQYPDLFPIMRFCKVAETRRKMFAAKDAKCMEKNTPLLESTLALRYQIANLMGKADHTTNVTQYLMSKSKDNVVKFEDKMVKLLHPHGVVEMEKLLQLKKKDCAERGIEFDGKFNIYDNQFYHQLMLKNDYQVDNNLIKEYFPFEIVLKGIFSVYQELLGMTFHELPCPQQWHEDVKFFRGNDATTGELLGHFYLDLFPREGKFSHAAVFPLQPAFRGSDGRQYPCVGMVCNFPKPSEAQPSLLPHDDVVTFFHEFGHLCHGILTTVKYSRFSGTSVDRDFVECPSQLFENWCWNKDVLSAKLSGHFKDHSKKLPEELIQKLVASKNVNNGLFYLRQLGFSTFDTKIHGTDTSLFTRTAEFVNQNTKEVSLFETLPNTNSAASFGHIMGGYDAQYYSYMWSEVFAADCFAKFDEEGVMNKDLGKKLRDKLLAPGGSADPNVLIRNFLGREINEANFLKSIGLSN